MRAFVITLSGNKESFEQADVLIDSSNHFENSFMVEKFIATTSDNVVETFLEEKIQWNYPWTKEVLDLQSGLKKTPYRTADPKKRMACFMSHYRLWKKCVELDSPILVFEHDAKFIRRFDDSEMDDRFSIVSLNDPRGVTRRSSAYHDLIEGRSVVETPWIDDHQIPQGLPGNSAYYLRPVGAKRMLFLTETYGAWPNDALMCKQLMPKQLGCIGNYVTVVQRTHKSSTSDV